MDHSTLRDRTIAQLNHIGQADLVIGLTTRNVAPEIAAKVARQAVIGAETYFRVWVGNFGQRSEAQAVAERLAARGLAVLVIERDR
jgi:hypothetical protein